jgi:hypothetical protein
VLTLVLPQVSGQQAAVVRPRVVRASAAATSTQLTRQAVPLELEQGPMPLNTYNNKAPFKAKIKSVERIVGPKATGETMNIVIETEGKIPFWEGQSYGVIPPVRVRLGGVVGRVLRRGWCRERGIGHGAALAQATVGGQPLRCWWRLSLGAWSSSRCLLHWRGVTSHTSNSSSSLTGSRDGSSTPHLVSQAVRLLRLLLRAAALLLQRSSCSAFRAQLSSVAGLHQAPAAPWDRHQRAGTCSRASAWRTG